MGILESIEQARQPKARDSRSSREWANLSDDERTAVIQAVKSREVGAERMSTLLRDNGCHVSKHFIQQVVKTS